MTQPLPDRDADLLSDSPTVRFWGVRGSIASPGPGTVRYGGNTSCVEVRCGPAVIVFDAGTGLRQLGDALAAQGPVDLDLFFSHTHYDHICGLPFFGPAFDRRNRLRFWAGHLPAGRSLRSVVGDMMAAPFYPIPVDTFEADCHFVEFACGAVLEPRPGIRLRTAWLNHPNAAVGYRLEYRGHSLCYVTDTEHRPDGHEPGLLDLVRGADLMIYDSTYTDEEYPPRAGWGHSTWQECLRLADAAGVGRAVLFHHEPSRGDDALDAIAAAADAARPGTLVAREGLELRL